MELLTFNKQNNGFWLASVVRGEAKTTATDVVVFVLQVAGANFNHTFSSVEVSRITRTSWVVRIFP